MNSVVWSVLALAAGASIVILIDFYRARIAEAAQKREQLEEANTFLHVHEHSFEEFMRLDKPTLRLKRALIDFSKQVSSEDTALALIQRVGAVGAAEMVPPPEAEETVRDLEVLRSRWPGQAQIFEQAIRCGFFAALYRWPATEETLNNSFAYVVVDQQHQVDRTLRAAHTEHGQAYARGAQLVPA